MASENPTKGMTAEQKQAFKDQLVSQFTAKGAEVEEGRKAVAALEDEQGKVVDTIVSAFGAGPYKIGSKIVKARKKGSHYQYEEIDVSKIKDL